MYGSNVNNKGKIEKNKKIKEDPCIFPFMYKWKSHDKCYKSKNPYGGKLISKKIHDHLLSYLKTKKNLLRKNNTIKFKLLLK